MKTKRGIKQTQPLADFMPTILLKAKDLTTEITIYNTKHHNLKTESRISKEHIINNRTVRETLIERGIVPEEVIPEPDIKKISKQLSKESTTTLKSKKL